MAESSAIVRLAMIGRGPFVRDAKAAERSLDGIANKARNVDVSGNFATMTGAMVTSRIALGGLTVAAGGLALALGAPLIASAGAAALAVGALGVAAGGVLVAGLALAAGVAARYADTAHIAGSAANELRGALGGLQTAANRAISPAAANVMRGLADAAKTVTPVVASLRGAFATFGTAAGEAVRIVANGVAQLGPELRLMIGQAGRVLTALAPAVAPFLRILLNITNAAMPYLVRLAQDFTRTVQGWSSAVAGANLSGIIGAAVGHLRSWVNLASGVVRILVGIGAALAPMGGGWVASLAAGADRLADFIASARGVAAIRGVFGSIMGVVGGVAKVIGQLAVVAWNAGRQLIAAFAPAMPFLRNVLLPLIKGVAIGVGVTLVGLFRIAVPAIRAVARVLGWIGEKAKPLKPLITGVGVVIGTVFSGAMVKAVALASRFGGTLSKLGGKLGEIGGKFRSAFAGIAGFLAGVFGKVVSTVKDAINQVIGAVNTVIETVNKLPGVPDIGALGTINNFGTGGTTAAASIGRRASGGVVQRGELATLVGERGPELAQFPGGTRIHTASRTARMTRQPATMLPAPIILHNTTYVTTTMPDGRVLHQEVFREERRLKEQA